MTKTLNCKDLGFDCGFVAKAESEEALLGQVATHANEVHGITKVTPELQKQVKGAIKERQLNMIFRLQISTGNRHLNARCKEKVYG